MTLEELTKWHEKRAEWHKRWRDDGGDKESEARHRATAALLRELDNKRTYAWTSQPFNIGMEETSDRLMKEIR